MGCRLVERNTTSLLLSEREQLLNIHLKLRSEHLELLIDVFNISLFDVVYLLDEVVEFLEWAWWCFHFVLLIYL